MCGIVKEYNDIFAKHEFSIFAGNFQKQLPVGALRKGCSSNMQQITAGLFSLKKIFGNKNNIE